MVKQLTYTDFKEVAKQLKAPVNEEFKSFYMRINQDPTKPYEYFDLKPLPKDGERRDIDVSFESKCRDDKNKEIKGSYVITIETNIAEEQGIPQMYVGRTKSQLISHLKLIGTQFGRETLS